jgi:hypothetical protein
MKARSISVTAGSMSDWSYHLGDGDRLWAMQAFNGITYSTEAQMSTIRLRLRHNYTKLKIFQNQPESVTSTGRCRHRS